jgi:hypothetical protein
MPDKSATRRDQQRGVTNHTALPPDVNALIRGRVVTIPNSESTRFFAKQWKAMMPVVQNQAKETTRNVFNLKRPFFERFISYLGIELSMKDQPPYQEFRPSDWVAQALCQAAEQLMPDESETVDDRLWPIDRPVSEAWLKCNGAWLWNGIPRREMFEEPGPGMELQAVSSCAYDKPRIELQVSLNNDKTKLPGVAISILGEAACVLVKAGGNANPLTVPEEVRSEAKKIWDCLSHRIAALLGFEHPFRGKPFRNAGERAAWAHDHAGLSWTEVAKALCHSEHSHNFHCSENYRQQARQFWIREEKKYKAKAARRNNKKSGRG